MNDSDLAWLDLRLAIATEDTRRLGGMGVQELREALKDIPGAEHLTMSYASNGNQIFTIDDKQVEVGPMASNDEIRVALQNPFIKTENTTVSVTGAKFLADLIRTRQAKVKAQLADASTELNAVMDDMEATADAATKQVADAKAEVADLKAALGLNSNGGPA